MNKEQMDLVDEKLAEIKAILKDRVDTYSEGGFELLYHIIACTVWEIVAIIQNP